MWTLRNLIFCLTIVLVLNASASAEPENPVLKAAATLLPELSDRHRLELIETGARRGCPELVRTLQNGWDNPRSEKATEGRVWLALVDKKTPFPPTTKPSKLLLSCPDRESLEKLLEAFSFNSKELVAAAYRYEDRDLVRLLLQSAEEKALPKDSATVARAYLLLDDTESIRRVNEKSPFSDPVLVAWLKSETVSPADYYPDFLSSSREKLRAWRLRSAELAALDIYYNEPKRAQRRMQQAWLDKTDVTGAARRLSHRDLRLSVARHFNDVKEEGLIRLPSVNEQERKELAKRLTNVPDDGDGYPDLNVPAYFLEEMNTKMSRATFDALYDATTFTILGFPGLPIRRHYDSQFSLLHQAYDPTEQLRQVVYETADPTTRFQTLLRLGRYYPSKAWPIVKEDRELLKALPEL